MTGTLTQDGFGNPVASTGSSANPYMYAATSGYRNDGDAGLSHVGARYYDAQVGRFISRDTFLDQKPYLYCEHDPINAVDPTGHSGSPPPKGLHPVSKEVQDANSILLFNFNRDDWQTIVNGWTDWGNGEITVGGGLAGIATSRNPAYPISSPVPVVPGGGRGGPWLAGVGLTLVACGSIVKLVGYIGNGIIHF